MPLLIPRAALLASLSVFSCMASANTDGLTPKAIATAVSLRDQAMQSNHAYALVESLTTEVGPRMAGSEAYDRATVWAQNQFKSLGFDKVWLQPVTYPVWQRRSESARILSPFPQRLVLTALGGSEGTHGPLQADIVPFDSLEALMAAPAGSLSNKIAFVDVRMRRTRDGSGYGPVSVVRRTGASEAAKKGALAIIIRSVGTDSDRLPHTGIMHYEAGVSKIPAAALSNPDADLLENMLRRGQPVRIELNMDVGFAGSKTEYNVIGEITGRSKPKEIVIIAGHLDSWDLGTGAIDDGAGVAITMAAGELIKHLKKPPQRSIRVIAYANEEQGLLGGTAYANALGTTLADHQLGSESDFGAGQIYALYAGVNDAAWPVIAQVGKVLAPIGISTEKTGGDPESDIKPLADKGVPWATFAQDGSNYFDYHHTANDTLDKIHASDLNQQVAAYAVLAYLAAETDIDFGLLPIQGK